MKNNKTESEIFEQIKESLEHYEESYIPGSWENFLQKRENNNRKIFLRIASGIAACLLVGFLGLNYFPSERKDRFAVTAEQSAKSDNSLAAAEQSTGIIGEKPDPEKNIPVETPLTAMVASSDVKQSSDSGVKTASISAGKSNISAEGQKKIPAQQLASGITADPAEQVAARSSDAKQQSAINKTDTTKGSSDSTKSKTKDLFLTLPNAADNQRLVAESKRKVRFGINFSPGVSSTESSNTLNYMGGISADISLSSKVALSTGLQFENQSFVKKMPGIVSSANAPVNQTKTTVTNLDFPVNITWKFAAEKKHAYYVSAGLSSLVYLSQENKNTTYSQDLIPVSSLVNGEEIKSYSILSTMSVTQDAVNPAQTFDLAGRVNLMVGYEKKLSERIYIHFEPYAKFPTSSQEAGSLNHTTTGINFKISF